MTEAEDQDLNVFDWGIYKQPIHSGDQGYHNGERITHFVEQTLFVGDIPICLILLENGEWWITNDNTRHEDMFEDIGPFKHFDDALLHFRLIGET